MSKLKSTTLSKVKECEALINRNSNYRLSGALGDYFTCAISGEPCLGKIICDEDDQSSQFFSRSHAKIDMEKIKRCPMFGTISKEQLPDMIRKRMEGKANEIINKL